MSSPKKTTPANDKDVIAMAGLQPRELKFLLLAYLSSDSPGKNDMEILSSITGTNLQITTLIFRTAIRKLRLAYNEALEEASVEEKPIVANGENHDDKHDKEDNQGYGQGDDNDNGDS
ncbi:uncharacterized protein N7511_009978 [Penicillium nucicola]|uniref:uncharacterized protein n=1 Tax=Penicillium nucicola TaxID=1850975 RepID=UPI00254582BA|nr:uncharacterized protein N7511_009978 [Penicillium nucicola]KAJ5748282.1 hypothetical protein N7511_009978 [Penicillium nucicola]